MKNKKQIVFAVSSPDIITLKIAKALKKRNYETVMISLLNNFDKKSAEDSFNKIICLDFKSLSINLKNFFDISKNIISLNLPRKLYSIKKLNPEAVITVAAPAPIWFCALTKMISKKPVIYFPYDVSFLKYRDKKSYKIAGIPKFELSAEKYCLEESDGLMFKGAEFDAVKNDFNIKSPVLQFLPYCLKENMVKENENKLSKKDGEIHVVYIGYIESKVKNNYGMFSTSRTIEKIVEQKIHFHLYTNSQYDFILYSKEYKDLLKNKYFHLHKAVLPSKLSEEISQYDFGTWLGDFDFNIFKKEFVETCTANKMTNYIEAGIPFICYKNYSKFGYSLFKDLGACIGITPDALSKLKGEIKKFDYNKFRKNLPEIRQEYDLENNIPRLESFLERIYKLSQKN